MTDVLFKDTSWLPPPPLITKSFNPPKTGGTKVAWKTDFRDAFAKSGGTPSAETEQPVAEQTPEQTLAEKMRKYGSRASLLRRDPAIGPGEEGVLDAEAETNVFNVAEDVGPNYIPEDIPVVVVPAEGPNYLLWGGIGVGVATLLTITYFVARKK